jgi:hypothetical protein
MSVFTESDHITRTAGADLTAAQYKILQMAASGVCTLATTATQFLVGILAYAPLSSATGTPIDVKVRNANGTFKVMLGGTVAVGDALTATTGGLAITTTSAGNQVIGYACEAGVINQVIEIVLASNKY